MPRHFSEPERETIKRELIEKGSGLFGTYGYRRTSVEDVARKVGISKGAFYTFFPTKEDLFLEILLDTERRMRKILTRDLLASDLPPREAFVQAVFGQLHIMEQTPILQVLAQPQEYQFLFRRMDASQLDKSFAADEEYVAWLIEQAAKSTEVSEVDTRVLTGLLRGVAFLALHRREIGEDIFDDSIRLLLQMIAEYLLPDRVPDQDHTNRSSG